MLVEIGHVGVPDEVEVFRSVGQELAGQPLVELVFASRT